MRAARVAVALVLSLGLGACSDLGETGDLNYVKGKGGVVQIAPEDRGEPVDLAGDTLEGDPLDVADLRGTVVVIPVWGEWCTPCHAEAPELVEAAEELGERARFVGIDFRDPSPGTGLAFQRRYELPYPSLFDEGGLLGSFERFAPQSAPSTVVLDAEGRVAALVNGAVPTATTLVDVVEDVVDDG